MIGSVRAHDSGVNCAVISSKGQFVGTGGNDCKVNIWHWNLEHSEVIYIGICLFIFFIRHLLGILHLLPV